MAEVLPSGRELEILKILWDGGRATVRAVHQALRPKDGALAYTTVLTLLQGMEQKGLVDRDPAGKAHVYFAKARKASTFRKLAGGFLDRVFDGSLDQYVVHALESRNYRPEELVELEGMIAKARRRAQDRIGPGEASCRQRGASP